MGRGVGWVVCVGGSGALLCVEWLLSAASAAVPRARLGGPDPAPEGACVGLPFLGDAGHPPAGAVGGGRIRAGWGRTGAPWQHRPWGVQGPALWPQARPALTWKRSRAPGGAEKPRVRVFTAMGAGIRSRRRAAACRSPVPGGSAMPLPRAGCRSGDPQAGRAPGEGQRGSHRGRGVAWGRRMGAGGLRPEPFAVASPGLCPALGPCRVWG